MRSGMTLDTSKFMSKFKNTMGLIDKTANAAAYDVGYAVIKDSSKFAPTTPKKVGDLRASGKVEKAKVSKDRVEVEIGFDMPYAAKLHEAPDSWNWTESGSGPKYLERTLTNSPGGDHYWKMVATAIKLRGGI